MTRHHSQERDTTRAGSHPQREESRTGRLAAQLSASPRMQAQRLQIQRLFGPAAQRATTSAPSNPTGIPAPLKAGIESLSGLDLTDVRVHRNSTKPAQLNALAYAQGRDIFLGPQQERHLPHEAWHIVQQAQGRVRPTTQMMNASINDDPALEHEADQMGARAASMAASVPEDLAGQRVAAGPAESTEPADFETLQPKRELRNRAAINQDAWDELWSEVHTYFDDSVKGWFDVAAKTMLKVPKSTEFGHGSKKRGPGSERARSRFATLQEEIWDAARMTAEMPSSRALAQLRSAAVPEQPLTAVLKSQRLQTAAQGVAQLERLTRVIGGLQIDLDTAKPEELTLLYKNYFLPNSENPNFQQFGADIEKELLRLGLQVPKRDVKLISTKSGRPKYKLIDDYYYAPLSEHQPAGNTHYPDYEGRENARAQHVKMTNAGVALMFNALKSINSSKARFLSTDESFTNVYVTVDGVAWGLHLGDERQIFPIAGQGLTNYFDA